MITDYYSANIASILGLTTRNGGRGVGIEIEVEGRFLPDKCDGWVATRDGSLRGESFEYVIKGPCDLTLAKERLVKLEETFNEFNSEIKEAHRGSVHIHVNSQTKTIEQVFTTLFFWMLLEPLMLRLCGPQRDGNLFCLPSYLSGDIPFFAERMLRHLREKSFYNFPQRGKYASINTDALLTFGSLEFRIFPTHTKADVVLKWAEWCNNLVEKGSAIKIKDMVKVVQIAQADPRAFCSQVIDADTLKNFSDDDLKDILHEGFLSASPMTLIGMQHLKQKAEVK